MIKEVIGKRCKIEKVIECKKCGKFSVFNYVDLIKGKVITYCPWCEEEIKITNGELREAAEKIIILE